MNPFSAHINEEISCEDENLDDLINGIKEVNHLRNSFYPWYARLINWLVDKIPSPKSKIIYEWDEEYDRVYIGPERRSKERFYEQSVTAHFAALVSAAKAKARHHMMPKTMKVAKLDGDVA
jgi:hypothetical protein